MRGRSPFKVIDNGTIHLHRVTWTDNGQTDGRTDVDICMALEVVSHQHVGRLTCFQPFRSMNEHYTQCCRGSVQAVI